MTDEELRAQSPNLPSLYFDGYGAYQKVNGVLRCVAYIIGTGAQYNIITSLAGADLANRDTRRALDSSAVRLSQWCGSKRAH